MRWPLPLPPPLPLVSPSLPPLLLLLLPLLTGGVRSGVRVDPSFLLLEEDWPLESPLPISICPSSARIIDGDSSNIFSIEPSGECAILRLNSPLDADVRAVDGSRLTSYSLLLGGPSKSRATLDIQLIDVNDNVPQFIEPLKQVLVDETTAIGAVIASITSLDPDSGINGLPRFSLLPEGAVGVRRAACDEWGRCVAELFLRRAVTHLDGGEMQLTVTDGHPSTNNTHTNAISFRLLINSRSTTLSTIPAPSSTVSSSTEASVPSLRESPFISPFMEFTVLEETIADYPLLREKSSEWILQLEGAPHLPLLLIGGSLRVGRIDREIIPSHNISFSVTAKKATMLATTQVTLRIKDVNDNGPIFSQPNYTFALSGSAMAGGGVFLGRVEATDSDATSPLNAVSFACRDARFTVDRDGNVFTSTLFTRSPKNSTHVRIFASDGGAPPKMSSALIQVVEIEAEEMDTVGEPGRLEWSPGRRQKEASFHFLRATADGFDQKNVFSWFMVDEKTGQIQILRQIPAKKVRLHLLIKGDRDEVPVELLLNVLNRRKLELERDEYRVRVDCDVEEGSSLEQFKVRNAKGNVTFTMTKIAGGAVEVTQDGRLILSSRQFISSSFSGWIHACDESGQNAKAPIHIQLVSANVHKPVFFNSSISISIPYDWPLGKPLPLPSPLATDQDSHDILLYSLGEPSSLLAIDSSRGSLSLRRRLRYEDGSLLSPSILVADNGGRLPYHSAEAKVSIIVKNVDDILRIFNNLQNVTANESDSVGTLLARINLSASGVHLESMEEHFVVNNLNELRVARPLTGLAHSRICGELRCATGTFPFCVAVLPSSAPKWLSPLEHSLHSFNENTHYEVLLSLRVSPEGGVIFSAMNESDTAWQWLTLSHNGALLSLRPFDAETCSDLQVNVKACLQSMPVLCSPRSFIISIFDQNDHCPYFEQTEISVSVAENESRLPHFVTRLPFARDDDSSEGARKICYSTQSHLFFFPHPNDPHLYTNTSFDREATAEFTIQVVAYDCSLSCQETTRTPNGTMVVRVKIEDRNDNFPLFTHSIRHVSLLGSASLHAGSHIASLGAEDADGEDDLLSYAIRGSVATESGSLTPDRAPFVVDVHTGECRARWPLQARSYSFTLTVQDRVGHEDEMSVIISAIAYDQQAEITFDCTFHRMAENEGTVADLLSTSTSLTAVVDACRPSGNGSAVLLHFMRLDRVESIHDALTLLERSPSPALYELRHRFGMHEPVRVDKQSEGRVLQLSLLLGAALLGVLLLLLTLLCCRGHSLPLHSLAPLPPPSLPHPRMRNPYWTDLSSPTINKQQPLQSTEL